MMIREAEPETEQKSYKVVGYATTFEPYVLYEDSEGPVYEHFTAKCFEGTEMNDVIFQFDHSGRVYARMSNGTLKLSIDEHGLKVEADLGSTELSRQMYEDIASGLVTKMSWGFLPGEYHYDRKQRTIVHDSVKKIFDVSAVSIPANSDTEITEARNFANGAISKVLEEFKKNEQMRLNIELKLKLEGV